MTSDQEPSFFSALLGAFIPLAVAIGVVALGGFLIYLFWFGAGWIFD